MPSDQTQTDAYLTTKVLTASPAELRLMLLDGAVKFCRQGRDGLNARNYEVCFNGFSRTRAILVELVSSIRPEPNPDLHQKLCSLYMYMISRLLQASHEKSLEKADEVIKLLEYERETWVMTMQKAAGELRAAGGATIAQAAPTPSRAPAMAGAGDGTSSVSFEG
jgi:flagellar protein FliS